MPEVVEEEVVVMVVKVKLSDGEKSGGEVVKQSVRGDRWCKGSGGGEEEVQW